MTQLLAVADKSANALTMVLLLISTVTLLVSGIGIMNIMLATVSARTREIGIRKAMGATSREIRFQFLSEAVLISLGGGLMGVVMGLALPFSVRFLTNTVFRFPACPPSWRLSCLRWSEFSSGPSPPREPPSSIQWRVCGMSKSY